MVTLFYFNFWNSDNLGNNILGIPFFIHPPSPKSMLLAKKTHKTKQHWLGGEGEGNERSFLATGGRVGHFLSVLGNL